MEVPPPPPIFKGLGGTNDLLSLVKPKPQGMADSEGIPFFRPSDPRHQFLQELPDSVTASMTVASVSPAAPVSVHDHHWDFSIDENSNAVMSEPSSWLSLGWEAPTLSPSILDCEGDMTSMSSGKGNLSSSPEFPQTGLNDYSMDKLHSLLGIAAQCLKHSQDMPSRKFNNFQCGYLVRKLEGILRSASLPLVHVPFSTSEDVTRCIEVFKFFLALALKIESFIQRCCKDKWLQAAMTLTNTVEYVSSLGFNLELCKLYFNTKWTATKAPTAAEVDGIERNEVEMVKWKANLDVDVLLDKVISELPSLRGEEKYLATYSLQRLKRLKPVPTSPSPESPFSSSFDYWDFLGRIFQVVRQKELLGKGTSAMVHKAVWLGTPVAKKTFHGPKHSDYLREVQILGGLCHPNIMSMFLLWNGQAQVFHRDGVDGRRSPFFHGKEIGGQSPLSTLQWFRSSGCDSPNR